MDGVFDKVRSFVGVSDSEVEHTIDLDLDVILRDGGLRVNVEDLLLKTVLVGNSLENGDFKSETGLDSAREKAEAFNDGDLPLLNHDIGHKHF